MNSNNNGTMCPRCKAQMVVRPGPYGKFLGCTSYPRCKHTQNIPAGTSKKTFKPSKYQQAAYDYILDPEGGDAVIEAAAGSGKTTTLEHAIEYARGTLAFFAFNKAIVNELQSRVTEGNVQTLHSAGFQTIRDSFSIEPEVEGKKKYILADELLPDVARDKKKGIEKKSNRAERGLLVKLTSLVQNTLTNEMDDAAIIELIDHYGIATDGMDEVVLPLIPKLIELCLKRIDMIDYDDMIWMPIRMDLSILQYDWVFVDEGQDLNKCQIEFVLKSVTKMGRIVVVADENQACYGFRGADVDAVKNIIAALDNVKTFPLPVSYRCPKSHIRLAQQIVPEIQWCDTAKEGIIEYDVPTHKVISEAQSGDMILCRLNAPLVSLAFAFIRAGKKAVIRGRNIGENLIQLIDRLHAVDMPDLYLRLKTYHRQESNKLAEAGKEELIERISDTVDTIIALGDGITRIPELKARIANIFSDQIQGVILCSVHKAKGLEAESVYILESENMPFPMAKRDWQVKQEYNLLYVALTRSKEKLSFIEGRPTIAIPENHYDVMVNEFDAADNYYMMYSERMW